MIVETFYIDENLKDLLKLISFFAEDTLVVQDSL